MYGETDKKPKHYDELMLQAIRKSSTPVKGYVGGATPFTKVKKVKPAQLEFNFLDNITDAYEPMFNYEPLPSPCNQMNFKLVKVVCLTCIETY